MISLEALETASNESPIRWENKSGWVSVRWDGMIWVIDAQVGARKYQRFIAGFVRAVRFFRACQLVLKAIARLH